MIQGIPLERFSKIVHDAEKAYKVGDWLTIGRLNQELNNINCGMFWQEGKAYLWALYQGVPLPFDDIIEEKEQAMPMYYYDINGNSIHDISQYPQGSPVFDGEGNPVGVVSEYGRVIIKDSFAYKSFGDPYATLPSNKLYRDEDGNLQSDDFIPYLASDEDLLERYRKAFKAAKSNFNEGVAKILFLCSAELGHRGYTTNEDESDWIIDTVPYVTYHAAQFTDVDRDAYLIQASQNHVDVLKASEGWKLTFEGADATDDFVGMWNYINVQLVKSEDYLVVSAY